MEARIINRSELDKLFSEVIPKSAIFTATFMKIDKSIRTINCRRGVKCALAHPNTAGLGLFKLKTNKQKQYIIVYDMHKKGYRNMSKKTVSKIRTAGIEYQIVD